MAECLDEKLLMEKNDFIGFLVHDKKMIKDAKNYGMKPEELFMKSMTIGGIFEIMSMYTEWKTNVYLIKKAQKKYIAVYSYYINNYFAKLPVSSGIPDDWDACDSETE